MVSYICFTVKIFYRKFYNNLKFDNFPFGMGFFSEIKSALNEIFATFSQPVVWRGRVMNAIIAEGQEAVELETGGFVPDETFTVKFLERELDGEYPNLGEIVEYNEKQYRIHWVSVRAHRGQVEVSLRALDR